MQQTQLRSEKKQVHRLEHPFRRGALAEEFDLALVGSKGKWHDHKVSVSNPEPER